MPAAADWTPTLALTLLMASALLAAQRLRVWAVQRQDGAVLVAKVASELAQGRRDFRGDPVSAALAAALAALAHRLPPPRTTVALLPMSGEDVGSVRREPSLFDLLAFGGILPETINGRCAQLAFTAGIAAELATGRTMPQQLSEYPLAPAVAVAVVTLASLVPRLRDITASVDPKSRSRPGRPFNARSELVNGRTAMVGLVAVLLQEWLTGQPLLG